MAPASEPESAEMLKIWLDFVASLAASLAWPLIFLALALLFRPHITSALKQLRSLKWGDAEAVFEAELKGAVEASKAIHPPEAAVAEQNNDRLLKLIELAAASPSGAILEAWKDIENAVEAFVQQAGIPPPPNTRSSPQTWSRLFVQHRLLPTAETNMYEELRSLRNRAVHSRDEDITVDQARQYVRLADRFVDVLRSMT